MVQNSNSDFSFPDYLVFILFLLVSSLIGIFFAWKDRNKKGNSNYLTGGRKLGSFPVCMSLIASHLSSILLLGLPAEIYLFGTQQIALLLAIFVSVLLAGNVFLPVYFKLELTSVYKYLSKRFGSNVIRMAGSIGFSFGILFYLGVVLYGPSLALSSVTPLSVPTSILLSGLTCVLYTSLGGIKGVIWTDVFQVCLMLTGLLMVVIVGSIEAGGILEPWRIASRHDRLVIFNPSISPYRGDTFWAVFFGSLVQWGATFCVKQTQVQRYCSMKTEKIARKTLHWSILGMMILTFTAIWCGVVVFAKYHNCDPISLKIIQKHDQLMPHFVSETFRKYPGMLGLFVSCVFSGSLSTLSSGFNSLATVSWEDILKRYFRKTSDRKQLMITRGLAIFYGIITVTFAFFVGNLGTVLQAAIALSGSVGGPLLAIFVLGIFVRQVNAFGALIAIITGIGTCLFMTFGTLAHPRPKGFQLPVDVHGCSRDIVDKVGRVQWTLAANRTYSVDYWPEPGMNQIYHINYLYIPVIGFTIAIVVGILASLIVSKYFGNLKWVEETIEKSDTSLMSKLVCSNYVKPVDEDEKAQLDIDMAFNKIYLLNDVTLDEGEYQEKTKILKKEEESESNGKMIKEDMNENLLKNCDKEEEGS